MNTTRFARRAQLIVAALGLVVAPLAAAMPEVTSVALAQDEGSKWATITYALSGAPAVVTLDVQTNSVSGAITNWTSIGGANLGGFDALQPVFRKVDSDGTYTINWNPVSTWSNQTVRAGGIRAVVTAWALDDTPDYMVVDPTGSAVTRYYQSVDFLPGGLLQNEAYRKTLLVMRKIRAKNVPWTRGTVMEPNRAVNEHPHLVTLTNNYYIGVFEVTQRQYEMVMNTRPSFFTTDWEMRPVERVSYAMLRGSGTIWPATPANNSFLKKLRDATGIDFDLPSEAEWEFAARGGTGEGFWPNGERQQWSAAGMPGRCSTNGGFPKSGDENFGNIKTNEWTTANGTAIVGSYDPNLFGLYDVAGNVYEWCLDLRQDAYESLEDLVCTRWAWDTGNGYNTAQRRGRSGAWDMTYQWCRPSARDFSAQTSATMRRGCRLACRAGLK